MNDSQFLSVGAIVIKEEKVLLVRKTGGEAKEMLQFPAGGLNGGELPDKGLKRVVLGHTGLEVDVKNLLSMRFSTYNWWSIFLAEYVSGEPMVDPNENEEVLFLDVDEALQRDDVTRITKEVLKTYRTREGLSLSVYRSNCTENADNFLYYS